MPRAKAKKRRADRRFADDGTVLMSALTTQQRKLLEEARRIDDEYPMRMDALRSERAQAFRDCIAAGCSVNLLAAYLYKDRNVVVRWLKGPLPIERWITDTEPEGATTP